jgi:transposase-like protein
MEEHLFYEQRAKSDVKNSRHGRMTERIKTGHGEIAPDTSRDRHGSFELKLVKIIRFTYKDKKIHWLYAQVTSTQ